MPFPTTDYPTAVDGAQSRLDNVDVVWDDDFNYSDEQIRRIQSFIGTNSQLLGQNIAASGLGGMVSPVASGAPNRAFRLAARASYAAGYLLSVGDAYDTAYTEKLLLNYAGLLWTLGGVDASNKLKIPTGALPPAGEAGRLQWDTGLPGLRYDTGAAWQIVGGGSAGSYADWASGYQYTSAPVPVEEVIGQGFFDGSLVVGSVTAYFRAVVDVVFLGAPGPSQVNLYDMGPKAGPPAAPTLITTLSTVTAGGPQVLEQLLAIGVAPGANQIVNAARMYELTVVQLSGVGDSIYVGSAGLEAR
jgi:hypothetical protein